MRDEGMRDDTTLRVRAYLPPPPPLRCAAPPGHSPEASGVRRRKCAQAHFSKPRLTLGQEGSLLFQFLRVLRVLRGEALPPSFASFASFAVRLAAFLRVLRVLRGEAFSRPPSCPSRPSR